MPRMLAYATGNRERLEKLSAVFDKWDLDHSATLDLEEIKSGLRELGVAHTDAVVAKLFLDLAARDEYDDEIAISEKVVTLSEWLDYLPDDLAVEILEKTKGMQSLPGVLAPHVRRVVDERAGDPPTATSLSPLVQAFKMWDKDDSMTLDLDEIKSGLAELGVPSDDAEVTKLFKTLTACKSNEEYDDEIPLSEKAVSITEWLDNIPDSLAAPMLKAVMKNAAK
jgi:Ca2+-binding EF-hand superfamily protein